MSLTDTVSRMGHLNDGGRDCLQNCLEAAEACE